MDQIRKIGELLSAVGKKYVLKPVAGLHTQARRHATAVAAIVLSGQPRMDEPLQQAWARALRYSGIGGNDHTAAEQLYHIVIEQREEESARFTEIFKTAPVWLLQFTGTAMDARLLNFQLPNLSRRFRWGSAGYEEARRWPLLPSGMMTRGDAIAVSDERFLWLVLFCMVTDGGPFPDPVDFEETLAQEAEAINSHPDRDLLEEMRFALKLDKKPIEEWSRHDKRRIRKLSARICQL